MHEVALCSQLARAVGRAANGRTVVLVEVEVGALRQVVPEALQHAWGFVVRGTALDRAQLRLSLLPAVLACQECGARSTLGPELGFDCRGCGSPATTVVSGEEFRLVAIDVDTAKGADDGALPPP